MGKGHSVSYSLVDWIHLEPALNQFDINGCWSGSATLLAGESKPVILYTGNDFFKILQCLKICLTPFWCFRLKASIRTFLGIPGWLLACARGEPGCARFCIEVVILWSGRGLVGLSTSRIKQQCPDFYPVGDDGRYVLKASFNDHDYYRQKALSWWMEDCSIHRWRECLGPLGC